MREKQEWIVTKLNRMSRGSKGKARVHKESSFTTGRQSLSAAKESIQDTHTRPGLLEKNSAWVTADPVLPPAPTMPATTPQERRDTKGATP